MASNDFLLRLCRTLSPSEQSHFVRHLRQHKAKRDSKLLQLFQLAVKQCKGQVTDYRDASSGFLRPGNFPAVRNQLYHKLLRFLALEVEQSRRAEASRMVDELHLLINRGLLQEARKLASRAQAYAEKYQLHSLQLEIALLQRRLFRQFATQELPESLEESRALSARCLQQLQEEMRLHDHYERLYLHKRLGQHAELQRALQAPEEPASELQSTEARIYYYFARRLKASHERDREAELHYSQKVVEEFEQHHSLSDHLPRYFRAVNNLINSCFRMGQLGEAYQLIRRVQEVEPANFYQQAQLHSLTMSTGIIYYFLTGQTQVVRRNAPEYEQLLQQYGAFIPQERYLEISYNTAVAFLYENEYGGCLQWVNRCLSQRDNREFREERVNARIGRGTETRAIVLRLIAFRELGQDQLLRRFLQPAFQYFEKHAPPNVQVLQGVLQYLRQELRAQPVKKEERLGLLQQLQAQPGLEEFSGWLQAR